jgi:hypothetical protein
MTTDTERHSTTASALDAADLVSAALRAARLAEIAAETADWIAAELLRREQNGTGPSPVAADRISDRAAAYRVEARRQRERAASALSEHRRRT